jgi:hypothetical protein
MGKENIIKIIKNTPNRLQCLIELGWNQQTQGYKKLNKFINDEMIDISHFETFSERFKRLNMLASLNNKISLNDVLVTGSTFNRTHLKKRIYQEGLKKRNCELCGQGEEWQGKKMSLILDHINGTSDDNRIENLRIVCPNCNATLPTHCGKNKQYKKSEKNTMKLGFTKESYLKYHMKQRKTERPTYDRLKEEIKKFGYSATGKKYGVSDVAIRKWEKAYIKYGI